MAAVTHEANTMLGMSASTSGDAGKKEVAKRNARKHGDVEFKRAFLHAVLQKQILRQKLFKEDLKRRRVRIQLAVLRRHLRSPTHNTAVALHKAGMWLNFTSRFSCDSVHAIAMSSNS